MNAPTTSAMTFTEIVEHAKKEMRAAFEAVNARMAIRIRGCSRIAGAGYRRTCCRRAALGRC